MAHQECTMVSAGCLGALADLIDKQNKLIVSMLVIISHGQRIPPSMLREILNIIESGEEAQ